MYIKYKNNRPRNIHELDIISKIKNVAVCEYYERFRSAAEEFQTGMT